MIWAAIGAVLGVQLATLWALGQMNDNMDRYHMRQDDWLTSILRKVDPYDSRVNWTPYHLEHVREYYRVNGYAVKE